MRNTILKLFTISLLLNLFAPLGILLNIALSKNELVLLLMIIIWFGGIMISLFISFQLHSIRFEKEEILDKEIKKTKDRYDDNELFIKALKKVVFRKSISLKEVKEEYKKLKKQ